jgi:hypothetical protein
MRRAGGDASWMRRGAKAATGRERRRRGTGEEELGDWVDGGCAGIGEEQLVHDWWLGYHGWKGRKYPSLCPRGEDILDGRREASATQKTTHSD